MASYPSSIKTFTSKTNFVDIIDSEHINSLQDEVVAIETELGLDVAGSDTNLAARLGMINSASGSNVGIGLVTGSSTLHVRGPAAQAFPLRVEGQNLAMVLAITSLTAESVSNYIDFRFTMESTAGNAAEYARIRVNPSTVTAGSEDAAIEFFVVGSGNLISQFAIGPTGRILCYNVDVGTGVELDIHSSGNYLLRATSSNRWKKGIGTLDKYVNSDLIYDLIPRSFKWKKNTGTPDMADFGLVAEEVHEILPELIAYDEAGLPMSVKTRGLVILLLDQIQKLQQQMEVLRNA